MMSAKRIAPRLIERLPGVRGSLEENLDLARFTWFKVGGPAEVLFRPTDADDLGKFLAAKPADVAVTVIGAASNLLVRDGGVAGVVIRVGRGFADISVDGDEITAGAGAADINVARRARDAGLAGLEFMVGIPGTIGGALSMNAGAYGREMADVVVSAEAIGSDGEQHRLTAAELGFSYRHSTAAGNWIFTAARLRGVPGDVADIERRMAEIQAERETTQPIKTPTGGSTFRNPPGVKAWQLIEQAGCCGLQRGGAVVSGKHSNFLVNVGGANASDLEELGEEIRRRVEAETGVVLEWEIHRIGTTAEGAPEEVPS